MILDLLNYENSISYNITLANILGLEPSIYLSVILGIYSKAVSKKKLDDDGFFTINRDFVKKVTTFTKSVQYDIDSKFRQIKLITVNTNNKDSVKIDLEILTSIVMNDDESLIKDVSNISKKKRTKKECIADELKRCIKTTNSELRDAYYEWIDSVIQRQNWMTKKSVELGEQTINEYSNHDLDVALSVLNVASINGYRDIQWAINYMQNNKKKVDTIHLSSYNNPVVENKDSNVDWGIVF